MAQEVGGFGRRDAGRAVERSRHGVNLLALIGHPGRHDAHLALAALRQRVAGIDKQRVAVERTVVPEGNAGVQRLQIGRRHPDRLGRLLPGRVGRKGDAQRQGFGQRRAVWQAHIGIPEFVFRRLRPAGPPCAEQGEAAVVVFLQRVGQLGRGFHPQAVRAFGQGQSAGSIGFFSQGGHPPVAVGVAGAGGQGEGIGFGVIYAAVPLAAESRFARVVKNIEPAAEGILCLLGQPVGRPGAGFPCRDAAPGCEAGQVIGHPGRRQVGRVLPGVAGDPVAEARHRLPGPALLRLILRLRDQRLHAVGVGVVAVAEFDSVCGRTGGQRRCAGVGDRDLQPERFPRPAAREGEAFHHQPGQISEREEISRAGVFVGRIVQRAATGGRGGGGVLCIERRRQRVGVLQAGVGVGVRPFPGLARAGRGGHRFLIGWAAPRRRRQSRRGRRRSSRGRRFRRRRRRAAGQQQGQRERRETAKHGESSLSGQRYPIFNFPVYLTFSIAQTRPAEKSFSRAGTRFYRLEISFYFFSRSISSRPGRGVT